MYLTLLEPQSRSGDKPVKFQVVLSPNGTAVLKGLRVAAMLNSGDAYIAYRRSVPGSFMRLFAETYSHYLSLVAALFILFSWYLLILIVRC